MAAIRKTSTITVANPTDELISSLNAFSENLKGIYLSIFPSSRQERIAQDGSNGFMSKNRFNNFKFNKNIFKLVLPIIVVIAVGSILVSVFSKPSQSNNVLGATTSKDDVKTAQINKTFTFPLKDANNKDAGKFTYVIENAELRHQIVVKGSNATAVPGRVFLVINLKLVNGLDNGLSINTRDYVRVSVNGKENELFAPDIHNDPVEAQAISTKNTRLGIAVNENDKNIELHIGEIGGKKTVIPLNFK